MTQRLVDVVAAIADGRDVDWESADIEAAPDRTRRRALALRTVAAIITAHRTVQPMRNAEPQAAARAITSPDHQAIGTWGSYRLVDFLASGTSADVYRAYDPKLDRYIALKLLTPFHSGPNRGDAVIAEGRNLARIRHPNVAAVFAAERRNGRVGIAMELIDGPSLDRVLHDRTVTFVDVARFGTQLCDALAAVHGAGLIHRDVKLQNLIIGHDNRLVLTDFGTAADVSSADAGVLAGTPAYSAPEVLSGSDATPQSDLYSAAVVMFRLLTGVFPVDAETTAALRTAHRDQRRHRIHERRPDLPRELASIIDQNLAPDPKARFANAASMRDALARFTSEADLAASRANTHWSYRTLAFAFALLMAVAGLIDVLMRSSIAPSAALAAAQSASRNFVLVASFHNLTGDAELNDAVTYAVENDLQRTRRLAVMPRFRVDDVLVRMRRPIDSAVDEPLAREVALREGGVGVIVAGRVERLGSIFTIAARLLDPQTGRMIATVTQDAHFKDEIGRAVHTLSQKIIGHLDGLTTPASSSPPLERATTRSLRALTLYTESYRAGVRGRWPNALALARQAVAEDPDFASAQIWLAWSLRNTGASIDEYLPVAVRATALSAATDPAERLWIEASAHEMAGRAIEAGQAYLALLQIEPDHYWAINNMVAVFRLQGRQRELLELQRQRADRYPNDAAANLAAGNALALVEGDFAAARVYADRVRALARDDQRTEKIWALTFRATELLAQRNIAGMTREVNSLLSAAAAMDPELHDQLIEKVVGFLLTTGQVARAREVSERFHDRPRFYEFARAYIAYTSGDEAAARRQIVKADPTRIPIMTALLMTRLGLLEEAERLARPLRPTPIFSGDPVLPSIALARGDVDGAIPALEAFYARRAAGPHGPVSQDLAQAWLRKQQPDRAISVLREAFEVNRRGDAAPTGPHGPLWFRSALMLIELCHQHACRADAAKAEADLAKLFASADADFPPLRQLMRFRDAKSH